MYAVLMSSSPGLPPLEAFEPLLARYGTRKHPLEYTNRYQLLVMVVLSARDSDRHINTLAPGLFSRFPDMASLAGTTPELLGRLIAEVSGAANKAAWLVTLARSVGNDAAIPTTLDALVRLPGIGRKSANVIIRESGGQAEGIVVDLHVVRVAPRIGIAHGQRPEKIEKDLMAFFPKEHWNEAGMAISFLGREICRPSSPKCPACPVEAICLYRKGLSAGLSVK
jgi:endonuclease-3